jgi:hypothetical protein
MRAMHRSNENKMSDSERFRSSLHRMVRGKRRRTLHVEPRKSGIICDIATLRAMGKGETVRLKKWALLKTGLWP